MFEAWFEVVAAPVYVEALYCAWIGAFSFVVVRVCWEGVRGAGEVHGPVERVGAARALLWGVVDVAGGA